MSTKSRSNIVVGSGFAGIAAAYFLARDGQQVTLVERGKQFGGAMGGFKIDGYQFDLGCQVLENKDPETAEILLDILGDNIVPIDHKVASFSGNKITRGIEMPDLRAIGHDVESKLLVEVIHAAVSDNQESPDSLTEHFTQRFGPTAASLIRGIIEKAYSIDSDSLDPRAFNLLPFRRIYFLDDAPAQLLKQIQSLDDRIMASQLYTTGTSKVDSYVFYPRIGGMKSLIQSAHKKLQDLGVEIILEADIEEISGSPTGISVGIANAAEIKADHMVWAAGEAALARVLGVADADAMIASVHAVPLVLYLFPIDQEQAGPWTYIQNFGSDFMVFRGSVPGEYGEGTSPPGKSYATAEVLTNKESAVWNNPDAHADQAWSDLCDMGVVLGGQPLAVHTRQTPVSYRFPKRGYSQAIEPFREYISQMQCVSCVDDLVWGRAATLTAVKKLLSDHIQTN